MSNFISDKFRKLADQIDKNVEMPTPVEGGPPVSAAPENFGGAFCIVGPNGESIERLILDSDKDVSQFWGNLKVKAEIMLAELNEKDRTGQAFGRR